MNQEMKNIFTTKTNLTFMTKIYSIALLLFFTLSYPLSIFAQNNACGTSIEDLRALGNQLLENRAKGYVQTRGAVAYVPVAFHLVGKTDGTGRIAEGRCLDMLAGWNQLYAENNIELQFYFKYFNYINDDNVYTSPRNFAPANKMDGVRKADAMNVYCVSSADGVGTLGQTLAYYTRENDWIVCINSEVNKQKSSTIAHEVGHFFTLLHTFNGWDQTPFVATAAAPCAPVLSSGPIICTENVARTGPDANCATCGDYMCDTPADYNFGFGYSGCTYTGIAKDPKCVAVDPDETNIMGYFIGCSDIGKGKFSGQQKAAMLSDYGTARRAYLRGGNVVPYTQGIGLATLLLPANGSTTATFNSIDCDWSDVTGAVGYILEVSTSQSNFDIGRRLFINSATSSIQLNASNLGTYFTAGRTYYWRVRAFGNYVTTTDFTPNFNFTTGASSAVNEIPGIDGFTISPNPVSESKEINISLTSEKAFKANVKIQNLAGQIMLRDVRNFESGATNQTVDVKNLSAGMYILSIENEQGVLNKKIVVR
jgi:Secretion system C-terminal sorting domain/Pregnancy-associated plasma protein-A